MQRFFFHVHDNLDVPDEDGSEVPDLDSAVRVAVRAVRGLACEQVAKGHLNLQHRIEVKDAAGAVLATVRFADAIEVSA
jgi:hypothetical protein